MKSKSTQNTFPSHPGLTLEFAYCQEPEWRTVFDWSLKVTPTPHHARIWTRVNLESLGSQLIGVSLKLERLESKLWYERKMFKERPHIQKQAEVPFGISCQMFSIFS